ncbi:MAG: hypothetical protein KDA44_18545, partial [Planctomycetales bacterium]|nr:hypothetical protein [Planctomycetales bacterium]
MAPWRQFWQKAGPRRSANGSDSLATKPPAIHAGNMEISGRYPSNLLLVLSVTRPVCARWTIFGRLGPAAAAASHSG